MLYESRNAPADLLGGVELIPRKRGKKIAGKNPRFYLDLITAFDIETTRLNEKESILYIWQMQIGPDVTIIGRTWDEFGDFLARLASKLDPNVYIVIYVHNLAFEFQFLQGIFEFEEADVFSVEKRRVLRADLMGHFEFRCAYLHSNMSLEKYLEAMGVPDQKLKLDYSIKRYPWTKLTPEELAYCVNDVKGLVEALTVEMEKDGDDLYTIPATSTGYVRRDVKTVMRRVKRGYISSILPDIDTYLLLREAFRGGDTHANRYAAGQIIEDVYSYDRSSSYPDVIVNGLFPIGAFHRVENPTWERFDRLNKANRKCLLFRVGLSGVKLRHYQEGCPYIDTAHCRRLSGGRFDNGRVLSAEYLEITLTEVDWEIISDMYIFSEAELITLEYAAKGPLPDVLKECIISYYERKTALKGIPEQKYYYDKDKAKLNSIFGMFSQDPVKFNIVYCGRGVWDISDEKSREELLEESNKHAFLPYQWGIWTTAQARLRLYEGRKLVTDQGGEFLYCDTDSVKYIGEVDWTDYNEARKADSARNGAYADDKHGVRHYMGVYEPDDGYPARFATRGAKKYAVEHDGRLEVTIAGVNKKKGAEELTELGGLSAFAYSETLTFEKAGGSSVYYNEERRITNIDGHRLEITPCVTINDDFYTLSDTEEYSALVDECRPSELREYLRRIYGVY